MKVRKATTLLRGVVLRQSAIGLKVARPVHERLVEYQDESLGDHLRTDEIRVLVLL